jgi:hypothetical protein
MLKAKTLKIENTNAWIGSHCASRPTHSHPCKLNAG